MIVFYHIPKTAGLSLARAIEEAVPGPYHRVLLTEMSGWLADLERGACDVDALVFLAGHFGYGIHHRLRGRHQTLTFLRDPMDQTVSMHYEALKRPDIYPHGDLRTMLADGSGEPYFGNTQVRHLASDDGRPLTGRLSRRHLTRAKQVLTEELTCFGLTEYFAASVALINDRLGLRLTPKETNVSSSRIEVRDLDPELLQLIWNRNAFDRELYEYGRMIWFDRLRSLREPVASAIAVPA